MSEIIGRDIEIGVGIEKVRGTAQLTAEKWIKHAVANIIAKAEYVEDNSRMGVIEDMEQRRVVQKWIEGELSGIVQADMIGYLLYNLYGAVSSSNVVGSVYSHDFTMQQSSEHASLSVFAKDGSVQQKVYNNGMVADLEINASVDDFVRFTSNLVAKDEAANSDTPSYDTEYDFVGKDITIKVADSEAELSGATASKLKNLSIKLDSGLIRDHILGSYIPDDIYNAKMSIEGTFEKNYDDNTFKDLSIDDNSKYMQITIEGATDIGSGNYPTITILLYKVQITSWERSGDKDALVTENIGFKAFYNQSDSKQSKITLQNLTTEYDTPVSD